MKIETIGRIASNAIPAIAAAWVLLGVACCTQAVIGRIRNMDVIAKLHAGGPRSVAAASESANGRGNCKPQEGGPRSVAAASERADSNHLPAASDATERVPPVYGGGEATDTKRKAR